MAESARDPAAVIAAAPMSRAQIVAVAVIIALNALDGFDVLAISFASPGIANEWGIDRAALGFVLSMELIGMGIGSLLLGNVADRIGRRPMILACLAIMAAGMLMATTVRSIEALSAWRVFTGLGIGGMLASIAASVAEHSNLRRRSLTVSLMTAGYPLGAVIGGSVAALLLQNYDWRAVFYFGALATALFIPVVWLLLPETVPFLARRQPPRALKRINQVLARFGHDPAAKLPRLDAGEPRPSLAVLFGPGLVATTLLVTAAYFLHIATFYFILKWVPKIVADLGFAPSAAAGVLVWANVGGVLGCTAFAMLTIRFALKPLTLVTLLGSTVMVILFGWGHTELGTLSLIVGLAGVFTNGGVVALYATFAHVFPTSLRATGTGFAIGIGRAGAALSPIVAGLLLEAGIGLRSVAVAMGLGSALAAAAILALRREEPQT
jgi:benzoate transport